MKYTIDFTAQFQGSITVEIDEDINDYEDISPVEFHNIVTEALEYALNDSTHQDLFGGCETDIALIMDGYEQWEEEQV